MRFAVLGISHETNTFSEVPADYESFQAGILRRDDMVEAHRDSHYTIAGYIQGAEELGFDLDRAIPVAIFFDPEENKIGTTNDGQLEPALQRNATIQVFIVDEQEFERSDPARAWPIHNRLQP